MGWLRYLIPIALMASLGAQDPPHTPLAKERQPDLLADLVGSSHSLKATLDYWGENVATWRLGLVFRHGTCRSYGVFGTNLLGGGGHVLTPRFNLISGVHVPDLGTKLGTALRQALRDKLRAPVAPMKLSRLQATRIESDGTLSTTGLDLIRLESWIELARESKQADLWTASAHLRSGKEQRKWRGQELVLTASKSKSASSLIARLPKLGACIYLVSGDPKDAAGLERVALELFAVLLKQELHPLSKHMPEPAAGKGK